MKIYLTILAITPVMLAMSVSAAEKNIQIKDMPEAVQSAARGVIGGAKIVRTIEEYEGTTFYTVEYTAGGRSFEVQISPAGKILENVEIIESAGTPEAVRKVIDGKTKGSMWVKVEKATHDNKDVYIVKFSKGGGEGKLTISSQGELISETYEAD